MLEEDAMTRLEASAWPLACGSACVFALAVVLKRLPWQLAFAAVVLAVLAWAWRSPLIVGAALGSIAWLCVTGFDVHRFGDIRITGSDDAARAAVLVLAGVLTASAHLVIGVRRGHVGVDPVWGTSTGPASSRPRHRGMSWAVSATVRRHGAQRPASSGPSPHVRQRNQGMADLAYVLLTVAIFVLFGLIVKAVERL
jgi:hypothetical protein